ncbi:MAG: amino acid-binding protein [Candidatus Omnitrophica bacterium]|nr:amino acid-binding protein [Candidatus Omnitrophota bacterium]
MKIYQLSLFLENKAGQLTEPCSLLAEAGINILTLTLADTQQFGILRLIVKEWQKAKSILEEKGHVVNVTEVVAIEVTDRPGGLKEIVDVIDQGGLNIEYMYAFTFGRKNKAVLIFRFEDIDKAIEVLLRNKVNVIGNVDLYEAD